jgi:hypothetical protein
MPAYSSRTQLNRTLPLLILTFAAIAAVLWLLPLFSSHSVLFPSGPNFADILVYKGRFTLYHSAKFFTSRVFSAFAYPAGSAPIYEAFYKTSNPVQTYCLLAGIASLIFFVATYVCLSRARHTTLFLPLLITAGFPLIFLIQRGNIEIVLWIVIAAGIVAYRRGQSIVAALLFGLAATTKLYPIFMLGFFLGPAAKRSRQDVPAFILGVVTFALGMFAAVIYAGPNFATAARGFFTGVSRFQDHYVEVVSRVEIIFDHCFFSPVKYWAYNHHTSPAPYTRLYFFVAGTLTLLLFLRVRSLPFLNRVIFLTVAMVALPPVSFNYTLVHLYLPLLLVISSVAAPRAPATAMAALALLLFAMLPLASLWAITTMPTGLMQAAALLALMLLSTATPWPGNSRMDAY